MFATSLEALAAQLGLDVKEKKGKYTLSRVVAERKAFLTKKKLTYTAWVLPDDTAKTVQFSEMLAESGLGLSSGDSDMSPGFGFKTESYNTTSGARTGSITEQSTLFGKQYTYAFDYAQVRTAVEKLAAEQGYAFTYHIAPTF